MNRDMHEQETEEEHRRHLEQTRSMLAMHGYFGNPYGRDLLLAQQSAEPSNYANILRTVSSMITDRNHGSMIPCSQEEAIDVRVDGQASPELRVYPNNGTVEIYHEIARNFADELADKCRKEGNPMRLVEKLK
ncbi:MAG: hypothetical protein WC796_02995 [Candidatus Pacearchaeota archaeon]|jgi:hypothetical protein